MASNEVSDILIADVKRLPNVVMHFGTGRYWVWLFIVKSKSLNEEIKYIYTPSEKVDVLY